MPELSTYSRMRDRTFPGNRTAFSAITLLRFLHIAFVPPSLPPSRPASVLQLKISNCCWQINAKKRASLFRSKYSPLSYFRRTSSFHFFVSCSLFCLIINTKSYVIRTKYTVYEKWRDINIIKIEETIESN